MNLEELLEAIRLTESKDVKLYFVTRAIKPNISKRTLAKDKYLYNVSQMECNLEVCNYLYDATIKQLEKIIQKNFDLVDYDILTDDTEHLFTYRIQNKKISFEDVVTKQLRKSIPKIESLSALSKTEDMWSYCVEFYNLETQSKIYTFRKILPNKIGVDEKAKNFIRTIFNTQSQQLALLKEETVNLDEQIDCIFHDDVFYVIQKMNFEQIVGLQEDYKMKAYEVVDNMIMSGNFIGGDKLKEMVETKPSVHKKLIRVERLGGYKEITPKTINRMKSVCKKYGDKLPIQGDKLSIENEKDIDTILKVFADYYKIGEITKKPYGTYSGKELNVVNK